jgi:hypothetical protein
MLNVESLIALITILLAMSEFCGVSRHVNNISFYEYVMILCIH